MTSKVNIDLERAEKLYTEFGARHGAWGRVAEAMEVNYFTLMGQLWRWRKAGRPSPLLPQEELSPPPDEEEDELLKAIRVIQRFKEKNDPVRTQTNFRFDRPVAILWASCFHIGGRWTFHDFIRDQIETLANTPNLYMVFLGDGIEGFYPGFRDAASVEDQILQPSTQRLLFERWLDRVQNKVLAGFAGQHGEWWDEGRSGENRIKTMFLNRNIPYFDGQGYLHLEVGPHTYNVAAAHKFPGHSMHNPTHPHRRALTTRFPSADLIVMGDKHTSAYHCESTYGFEFEAGLRHSEEVHFLQVGTAKVGNDRYTLRAWENGKAEWWMTVFGAEQRKVKVTQDIEDVERWLG